MIDLIDSRKTQKKTKKTSNILQLFYSMAFWRKAFVQKCKISSKSRPVKIFIGRCYLLRIMFCFPECWRRSVHNKKRSWHYYSFSGEPLVRMFEKKLTSFLFQVLSEGLERPTLKEFHGKSLQSWLLSDSILIWSKYQQKFKINLKSLSSGCWFLFVLLFTVK